MALLKKKWFYPFAVAYVVFGIWFGSLNYKVFENQQDYGYITRLVLYPMTTAWRDGWICASKNPFPGGCYMGPSKVKEMVVLSPVGLLREVNFPNPKATYVTLMSMTWPIKVAANIISIILLYFAPTIVMLLFIIAFITMLSVGLIVLLVGLLL